jgi:hypothetical protein
MKAIVVSAALAIVASAGSGYADPIQSGQNAPPGAVSGLSAHGRASNLDLAFGLENPVTPTLSGLDARQNYQDHNWIAHLGAPARLPSWLEDEGWTVHQGSRFERSFLALGRSAFGSFSSGRSHSRMLRWSKIRDKIKVKHNNKEKHGDKHDRSGDDSNGGGGGGGGGGGNDDPGDADEHDDGIPFPGDGGGNQVATPEPGSMLLIGSGLIVLARQMRKRHDKR